MLTGDRTRNGPHHHFCRFSYSSRENTSRKVDGSRTRGTGPLRVGNLRGLFLPFCFPPKPVAESVIPQRVFPALRRFVFPQKIPQKVIDPPGTMGECPGPTFQSWSSFQQDLGPPRKSWIKRSTEREGFEPSTEVASCNSLAGSRFQPLSHLSSGAPRVPSARQLVRLQRGADVV